MAGDRIFMRTNLAHDPRVIWLADTVGMPDVDLAVGKLHWLWSQADEFTEDGVLTYLTASIIDRRCGAGFAAALGKIGWLDIFDYGVRIIKFSEYNGNTAKRRLSDAQRKYAKRHACPQSSGHLSASDADSLRTLGRPASATATTKSTGEQVASDLVVETPDLKETVTGADAPARSPRMRLAGFDAFWLAYPRKVGKGAAERAWKRIGPSAELCVTITTAIEQQKTGRQWSEGFIPNPATWLNQKRWEDEVEVDAETNRGPRSVIDRAAIREMSARLAQADAEDEKERAQWRKEGRL